MFSSNKGSLINCPPIILFYISKYLEAILRIRDTVMNLVLLQTILLYNFVLDLLGPSKVDSSFLTLEISIWKPPHILTFPSSLAQHLVFLKCLI